MTKFSGVIYKILDLISKAKYKREQKGTILVVFWQYSFSFK